MKCVNQKISRRNDFGLLAIAQLKKKLRFNFNLCLKPEITLLHLIINELIKDCVNLK